VREELLEPNEMKNIKKPQESSLKKLWNNLKEDLKEVVLNCHLKDLKEKLKNNSKT
jgi:DNA-binding IscR family transcriptional regulator